MPEQKMVDIDTSGNPVDVDIKEEQKQDEVDVQEVQEQESSVREVKPQQEEQQSNEEDLSDYSDGVKKRIDKLTAKMREAERRERAAIEYADGIKRQYTDLDKKYKDLDTGYLNEFKNRVEISKAALQDRYQKAVADNDVKAQVEAQEELTKLTIDSERLRASEAKNSAKAEEGTEVKTPDAPKAPAAPPDPRAEKWATDNSWFGNDEAMTYTAISIHKKLVGQEGFDPKSEEYYSEIDKRMKNEFPHKFEAEANNISADDRPVQAVASANRSSSKNARSKTVRLTPSQVAIAKKLGVPLTEYAKYVKQGGQA
jgi:hypothetical protein|tara:strand:+ start:276 stop:1214 length:939 start_codon:yes stop_codon:yes gene_type:complete